MAWDVHYVEETGSTNSDLLAMARAGAPTGTVLHAGHQTAGRGRLDRGWVTRPGSALLVSVLLRPEGGPSFWDTASVAVAAATACRRLAGVQPLLKWPNDLVIGERKLAGVLAEAEGDAVVVGCGLNLLSPPAVLGTLAIGLADLVTDPPAAAELLDALLVELDAHGDRVSLHARWTDLAVTVGRRVRVERGDGELVGVAEGIGPDGSLVVDGVPVHAGDVVHLRTAP